MEMNQIDKSNFFRGLLLLVSKDNKISQSEKEIILSIGKRFGYSTDYCLQSVNEILVNKYVSHKPPKFTEKATAEQFINLSIQIAVLDYNLHIEEIHWIIDTATVNHIDRSLVVDKLIQLFKDDGPYEKVFREELLSPHTPSLPS